MNNPWDITPRNGKYYTCERTCVALRIYYDHGSHQEISEALGLLPTEAPTKGQILKNFRGGSFEAKHTMWILSTEGICNSLDLRDHLDILLSKLDERIKTVQGFMGVKMGVNCIWWSKGCGGPCLDSDQMKKLGELRLECSLDISFFGDDDDEAQSSSLVR